ncbi:hypothetical protein Vretimale_13112 [Volvox reticuliferus]|uniref:FAD dependent oxidoreductase domain-containing protein n=1 Tax=Volvox reticuliferus TaxID=1737510 RepID=A0A8J4GKY1_9CHLO|nr:hypothetical protein Vretimale_13112 [Volvox reticuliferus]
MRRLSGQHSASGCAQRRFWVVGHQSYSGRGGPEDLRAFFRAISNLGRVEMRCTIPHSWRITRLQPCTTMAAAAADVAVVNRLGANIATAGNGTAGDAAVTKSMNATWPSSACISGAATPAASGARSSELQPRQHDAVHYAVVGAGLAGVATAWQLMRRCPRDRAVVIDLYDAAGIAAGGSGAAAGLLHPYNPRGKLLWRGEEAMAATLELVAAAAAAEAVESVASGPLIPAGLDRACHLIPPPPMSPPLPPSPSSMSPPLPPSPPMNAARGLGPTNVSIPQDLAGCTKSSVAANDQRLPKRFVWSSGLVRPAANAKQAADFAKAAAAAARAATGGSGSGGGGGGCSNVASAALRAVTAEELQALVPGLLTPLSGEGRGCERVDGGDEGGSISREGAGGGGGGEEEDATATATAGTAVAGVDGGNGGTGSSSSSSSSNRSGDSRGLDRRSRRAAKAAAVAAATDAGAADVAGLLVPQGMVLDVGTYLRALWRACQLEAEARGDGSLVRLRYERVESLERLRWAVTAEQREEEEEGEGEARPATTTTAGAEGCVGQYDAIVVAAGAAAATIDEVKKAQLPLQLCQGLTLVMRPPLPPSPTTPSGSAPAPEPAKPSFPGQPSLGPSKSRQPEPPPLPEGWGYPADSPSLLGQPYMAAQGPMQLVVGATKSYGWTPEDALAACARSEYADAAAATAPAAPATAAPAIPDRHVLGRAYLGTAINNPDGKLNQEAAVEDISASAVTSPGNVTSAESLRAAACGLWAPLARWRISTIRQGVRALPPRTAHGSLPLLGRLGSGQPWWLVAGLGSRGLVYHGLVARLTADAIVSDSEEVIPKELMAWREVAAGTAMFEAP